jgi:hypothetical protein
MSINQKHFGLSDSLVNAVNEALHPNQKKLDVAEPKGKLDAADFKKLRKEENVDEDDKHFEKQSKKMQDAINLHLRRGKSYADAVKAAKVHVKEDVEVEEGFVVRYNNPKSEKHGSEKHFDDQVAAKKHAARGNLIDKVGGKYTVHKTNEKGHDVKEEALDELSKTTLGSYAGKAATQRDDSRDKQGRLSVPVKDRVAHSKLAFKRAQGVKKAISKLGEEALDEKAVSQAQQKAAGAALATQRGEYAGGKKGGAVNRMALMKAGELRKIAATKRKGLPMRKEEAEVTEADDAVSKQIAAKKDAMQKQIQQKIAQKQMSTMQAKANKRLSNINASSHDDKEEMKKGGKEKIEINPAMRD